MLLVVDVGNSNIVLGIYDGGKLVMNWRVSTDTAKTSDEYAILFCELFRFSEIAINDIKDIILSSVVPVLTGVLEKLSLKYFHLKPYVIGPGIKTGMPIQYENPKANAQVEESGD